MIRISEVVVLETVGVFVCVIVTGTKSFGGSGHDSSNGKYDSDSGCWGDQYG